MPVTKDVGDRVVAGALNKTGSFIMRADKVGADTLLAQIVQMVAQAQRSRAPIQRLADTVSGWFVPTVIAIALLAPQIGMRLARTPVPTPLLAGVIGAILVGALLVIPAAAARLVSQSLNRRF